MCVCVCVCVCVLPRGIIRRSDVNYRDKSANSMIVTLPITSLMVVTSYIYFVYDPYAANEQMESVIHASG